MARVRRANVILNVSAEEVDKYMAKGFSLIDEKTGAVIKQSVPTELTQLQKAYSDFQELIKQKDAEIATLKTELEALKTAGVKKTPAGKSKLFNEEPVEEEATAEDSNWDEWADAEEVEEKPKKKKSKA